MSHQQQQPPPPQQQHPYPPNGRGRGRGYGNSNYHPGGGRGGGIPVGAWQPAPAMYPNMNTGGVPPPPPPPTVAGTTAASLTSPPPHASSNPGGATASTPTTRTPNLQPAPLVHPYPPGGGPSSTHPSAGQPRPSMPPSYMSSPPPGGAYHNPYAPMPGHPYANHYPPQQQPMSRSWQPPGGYPPNPASYAPRGPNPGGGGTMYFPMAPSGGPPSTTPVVVPPPREKKILTITDKDGNPIDLTGVRGATKAPSVITDKSGKPLDLATKNTPTTKTATTPSPPPSSSDAGQKMLELARSRMQEPTKSPLPPEAAATPAVPVPTVEKEPVDAPLPPVATETPVATPTSSLAQVLAAEAPPPAPTIPAATSLYRVYTKEILLRYKELPECMERPADLPEMVLQRTEARSDRGRPGGGGGASGRRNSSQRNIESGGGGGDQWARGNTAPPRRQSSQSDRPNAAATPDAWSRGQAPPKQQPPPSSGKGGRGGRGSYTAGNQYYNDGPVEPLIKSENHWRPRKNTSALVVAEKKVKAILNKMTKEKFDRLSEQMLEIPLLSYETLNMMINNVYEKAIDEPTFGDMYANLCVRLSQIASDNKFVHIIESDEEPPTDDGQAAADPSSNDDQTPRNKVYRWSHDVSTSDAEIVGPFASVDECLDAALDEEERTPTARGDLELELVSVSIQRGIFIKIMKKATLEEGEEAVFYVVYFPISEAEDCGQQVSEIFLSEVECKSDASKKNSFKRSLLNKCEEEFVKKDIYDAWQKEKQHYEERKSKLTDQERAEEAAELEFRRLKIKKQMLGNVKFIGQLYKVNLLREKVMRFCVGSMLKLEERTSDAKAKNPEYVDSGNMDIDEEDHEAICNMFATIGSTIDKPPAAEFMKTCFQKIDRLIQDQNLPSRSRFMYKDLLDLRSNNWIPRRKEEKAKTIAEIRKDVEAEERRQAELSAQLHARGKSDPRSSGRGSYYDQRPSVSGGASNRPRSIKTTTRTDDDGFMTVVGGRSAFPAPAIVSPIKPKDSVPVMKTTSVPTPSVPSLSTEELTRRIKRMRTDFLGDGGNVQELLLSWDEIAGTPDAGVELVKQSADRMLECKDDERAAIYKIVRELCERGKLTKADVQNGLVDAIEFVDSVVFDCPRIYEYLGILIGDMLRIKMFEMSWLCDQCEKTKVEPETVAPASLMRFALLEWKKLSDSDVKLLVSQNERRLKELLGADSLKSITDAL